LKQRNCKSAESEMVLFPALRSDRILGRKDLGHKIVCHKILRRKPAMPPE
jgi:hypothetical protein